MQKLTLVRLQTSDQGTLGRLISHDGNFQCLTLELPWRENQFNISCIPAGTYPAKPQHSPRFNKTLYRLDDSETAPRSAILIHAGNTAGDTSKGYQSDAQGCILLGESTGLIGKQLAILNSKNAIKAFHQHNGGQPISIRIVDASNE